MIRVALGVVAALAFGAPAAAAGQATGRATDEPEPIVAGRASPPGRYADDGVDVLHYDIQLALPDGPGWIRGRVAIDLRTTTASSTVTLDFTGLLIDRVRVDGTPTTGWSLDEGLLMIPYAPASAAGERRRIEIDYHGTPDDGLILGETVYGEPSAFVDNWPNRTRFWLPSIDHPSDKATARMTVHAPAAWTVVANGRTLAEPVPTPDSVPGPEVGPRRTWVYATDVPQPTYTLVVGGAEMVVDTVGFAACGAAPASTRADGCIAVTTWLFPESARSGGAGSFRRAAEMVDFFTETIGPFSYEKLAHVQSATRFGGMENSSAIFYSQQAIAQGRDIEGTVSHETAHQWFGDSVTPADWSHLWLSEGFATYFGALYFEHVDGPDALRERMASAAATWLASGDTARPVIDDRADLFGLLNRNSYQKGALILHMLRRELGDGAFFQTIRTYYDRFRNATATSDDLRAVAEEVSDRDLGVFFDQWLRHPGYPVIEVDRSAGTDGMIVGLKQIQGAYAPRFVVSVDVQIVWDGGTVRETVRLDGSGATLQVRGAPIDAEVVLDPGGWLLHRRVDTAASAGLLHGVGPPP